MWLHLVSYVDGRNSLQFQTPSSQLVATLPGLLLGEIIFLSDESLSWTEPNAKFVRCSSTASLPCNLPPHFKTQIADAAPLSAVPHTFFESVAKSPPGSGLRGGAMAFSYYYTGRRNGWSQRPGYLPGESQFISIRRSRLRCPVLESVNLSVHRTCR